MNTSYGLLTMGSAGVRHRDSVHREHVRAQLHHAARALTPKHYLALEHLAKRVQPRKWSGPWASCWRAVSLFNKDAL